MSPRADILDRPEHLGKPFWASLSLHLMALGSLLMGTVINSHLNMGTKTGGGIGGLLVNPVSSIPIPNRGGPENPVANDTQSQVPTPPAPKEKPKPVSKARVQPPDAIPLKSEKALAKRQAEALTKRQAEALTRPQAESQTPPQPNKFRDHQKDTDSQLYSTAGPRANTSAYQVQGGGGLRLGDNSPFGEQFGWYANIIRDKIAQNWRPQSRTSTAPSVTVTFTIHRDGSVDQVKISQTSGVQTMDFSAQRAVLDATPLPALPPGFPRNQADVELKFQLGN